MVQGSVGLSQSMSAQDRTSLLGNPQSKTSIISTQDINNATLINQAKQNAETLCKGKTRPTSTSLVSSTDDVLCYQETNLKIDLRDDILLYSGKTIIMQSGNIILSNSMRSTYNGLDIFIDQGNLYLQSNPSNMQSFDKQ